MNTVNHDSYFRLALSENHHNMLHKHLFPGVGLEAAAILLCSQSSASRYLVKDILLVDYSECRTRTNDFISWPGTYIENAIDAAETNNLSIVLVHSHPGGTLVFSDMDDDSDREVLPALFEANESLDTLHGSAIMTPDGAWSLQSEGGMKSATAPSSSPSTAVPGPAQSMGLNDKQGGTSAEVYVPAPKEVLAAKLAEVRAALQINRR